MAQDDKKPTTKVDRSEVDATHAGEKQADLKKVTPNSAPPKDGEAHLVDRSAPVDNNVAEVKTGERKGEGELAPVQPGDPKVKTNEGGVVTERDATTEEVKSVDARKAPEHVTEADQADDEDNDGDTPQTPAEIAQARDEASDNGGDNGQVDDEEVENPTVKMKNPSGREVEVRISDIAHHKMFAAGFQTVEGEDYPAEVVALEDAYKNNIQARGLYTDVDQSDPGQPMAKGDIARRKGTKDRGDADGEPQARVAAPKNADKPQTFDAVDKRENGQVVNPKNNNPLKSNRLAQALQQ